MRKIGQSSLLSAKNGKIPCFSKLRFSKKIEIKVKKVVKKYCHFVKKCYLCSEKECAQCASRVRSCIIAIA